jgi:hypothetical protein
MLDQFKERMDQDQEDAVEQNRQRQIDLENFQLYQEDANAD